MVILLKFNVYIFFVSDAFGVILKARTSNTMLKRSGESGYCCLITDLRRKAQAFTVEYGISCGSAVIPFIMLRV